MRLWLAIMILPTLIPSAQRNCWAGLPLSTEDAGTVPRGVVEMELLYEWALEHDEDAEYGFTLSYGVSREMEAGIGIGYEIIHTRPRGRFHIDTQPGVKWRFFGSDGRPSYALAAAASIPSLSIFGTKRSDRELLLVASVPRSGDLVHMSVGHTWVTDPDEHNVAYWALAIEHSESANTTWCAEILGDDSDADRGQRVQSG